MRLRSLPFALFVLVACALIFWLPLHVPMAYSGSISYMLGFNNRAALYALLLVLAVGGFALSGHRLDLPFTSSQAPTGPSRRAVLIALGIVLAGCLLLTLIASPMWGMDESPYLIGRVRQVLAGARPYVDFEFIYGPALLYLPAWTARLLRLGAGPAYFIVWTAEWLVGTLMAALVVRLLGFRRAHADAALAVLLSLFAASLLSTGETYTPFRELASLLSLLLVARRAAEPPTLAAVCHRRLRGRLPVPDLTRNGTRLYGRLRALPRPRAHRTAPARPPRSLRHRLRRDAGAVLRPAAPRLCRA